MISAITSGMISRFNDTSTALRGRVCSHALPFFFKEPNMKCYCCDENLIWGGDENCDDDDNFEIMTNLSCSKCEAFVIVYWQKKEEESC